MRNHTSLIRHWLCSTLCMLFLAEQTHRLKKLPRITLEQLVKPVHDYLWPKWTQCRQTLADLIHRFTYHQHRNAISNASRHKGADMPDTS